MASAAAVPCRMDMKLTSPSVWGKDEARSRGAVEGGAVQTQGRVRSGPVVIRELVRSRSPGPEPTPAALQTRQAARKQVVRAF